MHQKYFLYVYNVYVILYIDETENKNYFIVAGLLVNSYESIEKSYKSFKKSIIKININPKYKSKMFIEFKSTILDNDYQSIKIKLLKTISKISGSIIYSCYIKKSPKIKQVLKESTYINLLSNIVKNIKEDINIIFDSFNKRDFELNIKQTILKVENVKSIAPMDSQIVYGLQFIDNICSVIRLYISKSEQAKSFYPLIKNMVKEVK